MLNLISGLQERYQISVISAFDGDIIGELKQMNIETNIIRFRPIVYCKTDTHVYILLKRFYVFCINFFARQQMTKYVKKNKIDIIHSNSSIFNIGYQVSRKTNTKHVWHIREFADLDYNYKFFTPKRFRKQLFKSDFVIAVSHALINYYQLDKNCMVIYNGVMKEEKACINLNKSDYFLFFFFLNKQKGIEDAIYAFSEKQKKHANIQFLVVGGINNNYKCELDALCKKLSVSNIVFMGRQKDISSLMINAKALLMCSYYEAMGRVTAEAMMYGCPVIGYNNAGTGEIISHSQTGFLYENRKEFIQIMDNLLSDYSICYPIIENAFQFGKKHFSQEQYASNISRIYHNILNK
jgi:glycosyltransferase involved in cell wall biosynthesis